MAYEGMSKYNVKLTVWGVELEKEIIAHDEQDAKQYIEGLQFDEYRNLKIHSIEKIERDVK